MQVPVSVVRRCLLGAGACFKYSGGACLVQVPVGNSQGYSLDAGTELLAGCGISYSRSGVACTVGARSIRAAYARSHWQ